MEFKMSDDEVRAALMAAMQAKIEWNFGEVTDENSFVSVTGPDGDIADIEEVTFTVVL